MFQYVLSIAPANILPSAYKSGGTKLERPISSGSQEYSTNPSVYPVSEPIIKIEAMAQTSGRKTAMLVNPKSLFFTSLLGEAEYLYDIPDHPHQLFAAFVLANAKPLSIITKVDPSKALVRIIYVFRAIVIHIIFLELNLLTSTLNYIGSLPENLALSSS